jgi:maleylpyruvate isomerase
LGSRHDPRGLDACEVLLGRYAGPWCLGDRPTIADATLVPQLANARRFGAEGDWPRIAAIAALAATHQPFSPPMPARNPTPNRSLP